MLQKKISQLTPHELNAEIYGEEILTDTFLESISNKGVLVPLTIKDDGTIISGHRRYKAAQKLGKEQVPVTIKEFKSKLEEKEAILSFNSQREKTYKQKMREAEKWEEIEREKAQKRKKKTQLQGKDEDGNPDFGEANICTTEGKGKTRDKIAKKIKIGSGETYRKAKKVWDKAQNGDGLASSLVEEINGENTSISAAYDKIMLKENYIDQIQDENILDELILRNTDKRYIETMAQDFTREDRQKIIDILKNNHRKTVKSVIKEYKEEKKIEASRSADVIAMNGTDSGNNESSESKAHNDLNIDESGSSDKDLNSDSSPASLDDLSEDMSVDLDRNNVDNDKKEEEMTKDKEGKNEDVDISSINIQDKKSTSHFSVKRGDWWRLGDHLVYCGDTGSQEFKEALKFLSPEKSAEDDYVIELAFADPPYNVGVAEWDKDFEWRHDYLADIANITAVTPGIETIKDFLKKTDMPYKWSIAAWIKNGMTRGKLGYGNWIFTALFSESNIYQEAQDHIRITVGGENRDHKGQKPSQLLVELLDIFTSNNDFVLDPFLGTGTALFAAEEMGRICVGGEIEASYCRGILERWQEAHSEDPYKINKESGGEVLQKLA